MSVPYFLIPSDCEFKKAQKTPSTSSSAEADKSKWAPRNTKNSDTGKQQPQGQHTGTTFNDKTIQVTPPITKSGSWGEKQNGSADQTNTQSVKPMSVDEDTDDDYMPFASESESEAEQMSDIEATEDKVANLQRE